MLDANKSIIALTRRQVAIRMKQLYIKLYQRLETLILKLHIVLGNGWNIY